MTDDAREAGYRDALHAFQRAQNVPFGDAPGPGSVTERKLTEALDDLGAAERYIWRTAGDGKVRHEHALREGKIYSWNNPSDDGEHPGDDYNCRCWAEPLNPSRHPWAAWARKQQAQRDAARVQTLEGLKDPLGLKLDPLSPPEPDGDPYADAINPVYPIETLIGLLSGAGLARSAAVKAAPALTNGATKAAQKISPSLAAKLRDTSWIKNAPISKIQHTFKEADKFGVKGNWNKINGERFRASLENHIKSPNTKEIKGTYNTKEATHYYNKDTGLNVIRNEKGNLEAAWKLSEKQKFHMLKNGKIGGSNAGKK